MKYTTVVKCEVLYETLHGVLNGYADYLNKTPNPDPLIEKNYQELAKYSKKIILCDSEEEYDRLKAEIMQFEKDLDEI